jgi:hypothetical protein
MGVNYYENNDKKPNISWWMSWPAIIISFLIFWPIGAFLLWRKIAFDKKLQMFSGRAVEIIGWVLAAFAALGTAVSVSEGITGEDVSMIIFFLAAGAVLIFLGRLMRANAAKYKKYINIVGNQHMYLIDNIAGAAGLPADKVKVDLQKMIDKGYFTGAYIDEANREIILPVHNVVPKQENNTVNEVGTLVVTCKSCGANNTIVKGTTGECEYCGAPIA